MATAPAGRTGPFRLGAVQAAIDDQNRRIVAIVMQLLGGLGEGRSVENLRRALATTDQRTRANAVEAVISLPHRRFVLPILPLLEAVLLRGEPRQAGRSRSVRPEAAELLRESIGCGDPWIRLGASCTARALGLVADAEIATHPPAAPAWPARRPPTELDMEQVLFLKRVPLFRHLPLDALLAVGRSLQRETYLAGDVICKAGAPADHFCIVASGAVDIVGPDGRIERLTGSDYFGELALVEEAPRWPRIVAAEDCVLLRLHRLIFQDLSSEHPDIVMELCRLLARRLRQVQAQPSAGAVAQNGPFGRVEA